MKRVLVLGALAAVAAVAVVAYGLAKGDVR